MDKMGHVKSKIQTKSVDIAYEQTVVVEDLNITIPTGKITALVGANGSGKSTILKTIGRILKNQKGTIYFENNNLRKIHTKALSKRLTILPQNPIPPKGLRVDELVAYGRAPHQSGFNTLTKKDRKIIYQALEQAGVLEFAERDLESLSGGQLQRVWIALALAQQTDVLLLDEPTTFLDMSYQMDILQLLNNLNKQNKSTIIMVVHDLNHASRFADYIIAIKNGKVEKSGPPTDVITPETLKKVFDTQADVIADPRYGYPLCIPYGTVRG